MINASRELSYILYGEPRSWQRIGFRAGSRGGATPAKVREEQKRHKEAVELCRPADWPLAGRFAVTVVCCLGTRRRSDVDNLAKLVLDGIQGSAFENDSMVERLVVERRYDRDDPRTEVYVCQIEAA